MAIDTRNKRASVLGWGLAALVALPLPDGAIGAADRAHVRGLYAGIDIGSSVPEPAVIRIAAVAGTQAALDDVAGSQSTLTEISGSQATLLDVRAL